MIYLFPLAVVYNGPTKSKPTLVKGNPGGVGISSGYLFWAVAYTFDIS